MSDQLRHVPTAREIMVTSVITVSPDTGIFEAVDVLLKNRISGVPVVDAAGDLVGVLSEHDCLRLLASDEFFHDDHADNVVVADFMTRTGKTIDPDMDIYGIAHYFLAHAVRRFPVVRDGHLLGQVSRRDVLRGMVRMRSVRVPKKRYPDYRAPA